MFNTHNPIYSEISELVLDTLKTLYPDHPFQLEDIYNNLSLTPSLEVGHIAFSCFSLAKIIKKSPALIASQINADIVDAHANFSAEQHGPYLNFTLSNSYLASASLLPILNGEYFKTRKTKNSRNVMIEYSQPNTHKELHVGHLRNLCLGEALVNIHSYCEQNVHAVTYPGDVGTHVAKVLWYMQNHNQTDEPNDVKQKAQWLGEMYTLANQKLDSEKGSEQEQSNRNQLTTILKQIEEQQGEYYQLWLKTRKWSIQLMEATYEWAGVKFDRWFFESEVNKDSVKYVEQLHQEGKLINSDGAIGMDLSDHNFGFCMLLKSDGTGLYSTKDIELARRKFDEFGIEESIYVVDNRQSYHFSQVFKVLEKLGFEQARQCIHLPYEMVELPDGAMSSRKGNIFPITTLIQKMEELVTSKYLAQYQSEWSDKEISECAKIISVGAIKYGMLRVDNKRKIIFNLDSWLNLDGETGPYIQYSAVRIKSLLNKHETQMDYEELNLSTLNDKSEHELILKLLTYNDIACAAFKTNQPHHITTYLFDLCRAFNRFYQICSIKKESDSNIRNARLALSQATLAVITHGLSTIGVDIPDRM